MAGKLSFSIAINLLTENFKRGTNQVKSAFKSMQMQILTFAAALGAGGIGLSNFVSRFIDVARETNRVTTALKNVSGGMARYADNQRYLLDLAKKYGLEINALTANYAKFTAAASISGMSMMDQRKVFESVSRACTAFSMSADDSNGVMLALSQMMSKGKISSEELRLQMGERLPVALQAMAKAAGVSISGLDKLMKEGKLMSADVLPEFAEALNEMIPDIDTDNLETSVNRLKNTFTELVNSTGVQSSYKSLIDWLTGAISSAAENIENIVLGTLALITGSIVNHAAKWWASISSTTSMIEANVAKSNAVLVQATQQRIAAEVALEKAKTQSVMAEANARVALEKALQKEKIASDQVAYAEQKAADAKKIVDARSTAKAMLKATRERVAAEITLEATKVEVIAAQNANLQAQTYNDAIAARERLAIAQKNFASAEKTLAERTAKEVAAAEAAKVAAAEAATVKSQSAWGRFCNVTKVAVGKLVVQIKAMWAAFKPMIIITAITAVIGKLFLLREEAKRVKNIFADYQKEVEMAGNTQEVTRMQTLLNIMNDRKSKQKEINSAQLELGKMVDGEKLTQEELIKKVKERIALLKEAAMAEAAFGTVGEYTERNAKLAGDAGLSEKAMERLAKLYAGRTTSKENYHAYLRAQREEAEKSGNRKNLNWYKIEDVLPEFYENLKVINDATQRAGKHLTNTVTTVVPPPFGDPDQTELQKQQERYAQSLRELNARKEVEKLTTDEYNKAYDELNRKSLIEAKSSDDKAVLNSKYIKLLQEKVNNPSYKEDKIQVELAKVEKEYQTSVSLAKTKLDKKLISEEEYRQAIIDAAIAATNSAISIEGVGDAADELIKRMQGVVGENMEKSFQMPKLRQRDTTFDYKKTDTDKLSEKVDIWIEYRDNLKERLNGVKDKTSDLAKEIQEELNNAIRNTDDLGTALKIAQVKQDVEDFSKELNEGLYSGVKNIASSSDRMVSAFENLRDVMNDVDSSGWERIMAIWNAMINAVDSFNSIIHTIESITALSKKLSGAKDQQKSLEKSALSTVGSKAAEIAAIQVATEVEIQASQRKTEAATGEMAAKSTAAYAGIPYVGVALAAAQIVAMTAMIEAAKQKAPGYNSGGIYLGGTSFGDKGLARLNKGEMILNMSQQANLFDAINSGQMGGAGKQILNIGFDKVRGSDIYLSLKNYMKSTGKKL